MRASWKDDNHIRREQIHFSCSAGCSRGMPVARKRGAPAVGELVLVGVVGVVALVLRVAIMFVVVIWSLRADEKGRRHAIRVLELLDGRRRRRPP